MRQLSKSRFTYGLQCHRQLWWRAHEPDAPELVPDSATQALFDQGHRVGALARERVQGGVLIDHPYHDYAARQGATKRALESDARVIYEASFSRGNVFVAVDILERAGSAWRVIEVKSSTSVKDQHIPDVAIQLHVLRQAGLEVESAEIMHLNPACAYPDLGDLFTRADVTAEAERFLPAVPAEIQRQLAMLRGPLPLVPIGEHCRVPYECPFKPRCWPSFSANHVGTLYHIGKKRWELAASGIETFDQLPEGYKLHAAAARQVRAIREGGTVVESTLTRALADLHAPIAIIDFEAVAPAIPVWNGCHPFDAVPVQFSAHVQNARDQWTHTEWLASGPHDPREELVRRLAGAVEGAGAILAYNASYERGCLRRIAEALPDLARPVESILERLEDALPLVRDHVYDVGFGGSFSLKSVLPALVPGLGYEGLEIGEGQTAQRELERLLLSDDDPPASETARLRESLLRYCELDTWGVVKLIERLRELAGSS